VGVVAGGRPTDDVTYAALPESKRYVVGPTIELGFRHGFGVEVDALYHRNGYLVGWGNFAYSITETERANSWEFPVLLKYKFPVHKVKPFVEAGVVPRRLSGTIWESGFSLDFLSGQRVPSSGVVKTDWPGSVGIVTGGGVEFGVGRLQLSPQVRYTHWGSTPIYGFFGDGPSYQSTQEQVDVLIGIRWKVYQR
jgi:hypothetical protein